MLIIQCTKFERKSIVTFVFRGYTLINTNKAPGAAISFIDTGHIERYILKR